MKHILITGVSSGIGLYTAKYFLERGWSVFGSVRRESDANIFEQYDNFHALFFDVTDNQAVRAAAEIVTEELRGEMLDMLVNNAGIAVSGPLMHVDIANCSITTSKGPLPNHA